MPILLLLWLLGKCKLIKIIFQVYPTDDIETRGFCPKIKIFRRYFSGRPTFGGFIVHNLCPIGIYVVIPDTVRHLALRKNARLSHRIINKLAWLSRITGATSIGLAGQLGFIFEKRHKIPIVSPFYNSLYGSLFSLSETINKIIADHKLCTSNLTIGILGNGVIGSELSEYLKKNSLLVVPIEIKLLRKGGIRLKKEEEAIPLLRTLDILVNITPTGEDFLHTNCHRYISPDCYIVDFAHPGISFNIPNKLYPGNRVRRKGTRFVQSLPGNWRHDDIPACSLASILTTTTAMKWKGIEDFIMLAKRQGFFISN